MAAGLQVLCLCALFSVVLSDVYLHMPRGSNNRLNERSANRNNAARLFNSQNNNRGGYNAGDMDTGRFTTEEEIYYMKYWQSGENAQSQLTMEWTNQHGCGGNENNDPHKLNCNMVLQYMLMDYDPSDDPVDDDNKQTRLRDGTSTNTQTFNDFNEDISQSNYESRKANQVSVNRGLHESYDYYADCSLRKRNENLFTADQNLRGDTAKYTRQNPNGNRNGYECPEERDYYPYWHPTPWRDIAVLTDNTSFCDFYRTESFNTKGRQICRGLEFNDGGSRPFASPNNEEDCVASTGTWFTEYAYIDIDTSVNSENACNSRSGTNGLPRVWSKPNFDVAAEACLVLPPPPECRQADWSRVNHLGNGRDGVPLTYTWTIPYFPSGNSKLAVVRIRYNVSTDDYNPWATNSSYNDDIFTGASRSPVTQNPNINIGSTTNKPLRLAINTAQFGRTFEDRSHVMELRPRSQLPAGARDCNIQNLNVRGKRGNIVQTYPAVEYDFVPTRLEIDTDTCVHVQWTGSNTHNNGNPAGDGQAGDAGEGTGGTDKSNIVQIRSPDVNYPIPWDKNPAATNMFENVDILWTSFDDVTNIQPVDIATVFASAGYYHCLEQSRCGDESVETKDPLQQLLNNAPASFEGALLRFTTAGTYHYMCSRNNNFTNRSQKGQITVSSAK